MARLNLANWIDCTHSEGPGARFALWTQGCSLHCPGCCNPELWAFTPRTILSSDEMVSKINVARQKSEIEGVTLLGGEPFLQAVGLAEVARWCKDRNLTVMTFTGYTLDELRSNGPEGSDELLACTDLLVAGPYDAGQPETERNWAGSRNQVLHFLTAAYAPGIEYEEQYRHSFEIRLDTQGSIRVNGWPVELSTDPSTQEEA